MNYRILRIAQMAAVARYLVGPARALVLGLPGGEGVVTQLEAFLRVVTTPNASLARQIAALDAALQLLDTRHDRLLRGLFLLTSGLAELADGEAEFWRGLQARLVPEGLAGVNRSYIEEAEVAASVRSRLLPGDADRMASVVLAAGFTLDGAVTAWAETGTELGQKDVERAELRATDKRLSVAVVGEARRSFSRIMGHLVSTLDFHGVGAEVREKLLSKLIEAVAAAEERQRRQRAGEKVEPSEEDALPLVAEAEG